MLSFERAPASDRGACTSWLPRGDCTSWFPRGDCTSWLERAPASERGAWTSWLLMLAVCFLLNISLAWPTSAGQLVDCAEVSAGDSEVATAMLSTATNSFFMLPSFPRLARF